MQKTWKIIRKKKCQKLQVHDNSIPTGSRDWLCRCCSTERKYGHCWIYVTHNIATLRLCIPWWTSNIYMIQSLVFAKTLCLCLCLFINHGPGGGGVVYRSTIKTHNNIIMIMINNGWNTWRECPNPHYKLIILYVKRFLDKWDF